MNFLIDTNIVIPLEPTSKLDLEVNTALALEFHNLSSKSQNTVFVHPAISCDIKRDKNDNRKETREILVQRYPQLPSPPPVSILDSSIISPTQKNSNDWVDHNLLAALQGDSVDYLVTEDIGIHKKAKRLGLDLRVLFLGDAITLIRDLFDITPPPPPTVESVWIYELDTTDPIFDSLRKDYDEVKFDSWLTKCKREHRKAFVVRAITGELAGIVILKRENALPDGKQGNILKICTFKISELHGGYRLGELLLKPVFDFAKQNHYEYAYFTAFPKQTHLISFANDFGFYEIENKVPHNEMTLCKSFIYNEDDLSTLSPLEFNIRFGPLITSFHHNKAFIVPIKPKYHLALFPEFGPSPLSLFPTLSKAYGNSIRKAYISNSHTKKIQEGDNLLFYRSNDISSLTCIGIVEATLQSTVASDIARFVGKRTVYSYAEIEEVCDKKNVLAILFRLVCPISPNIPLRKLCLNGIIKAQPQSITEIQELGIQWIRQQIKM